MSKKDYELIARVVVDTPMTYASRANLVSNLSTELGADNEKFDNNRFVLACYDNEFDNVVIERAA